VGPHHHTAFSFVTLEEATAIVAASLAAPKRMAAEGHVIEQHDPGVILEAYKLLQGIEAADTAGVLPARGLRFTKLISPGCGDS
jgi:hypothetical protein